MLSNVIISVLVGVAAAQSTVAAPYTGTCLAIYEDCINNLNGSPAASVCVAKANACQSSSTSLTTSSPPQSTTAAAPYTGTCLAIYEDCINNLNGSPAVSVCVAKANACQSSSTTSAQPTTAAAPYTGTCLAIYEDCFNNLNGSPAVSVCIAKANACQSSLTTLTTSSVSVLPSPTSPACKAIYTNCIASMGSNPNFSTCESQAEACQISIASSATTTTSSVSVLPSLTSPACKAIYTNCIASMGSNPNFSTCESQAEACQISIASSATTTTAPVLALPSPTSPACVAIYNNCIASMGSDPNFSTCESKAEACQISIASSATTTTAPVLALPSPTSPACVAIYNNCIASMGSDPNFSTCESKAEACQISIASSSIAPSTTIIILPSPTSPACQAVYNNCIASMGSDPNFSTCESQAEACQLSATASSVPYPTASGVSTVTGTNGTGVWVGQKGGPTASPSSPLTFQGAASHVGSIGSFAVVVALGAFALL